MDRANKSQGSNCLGEGAGVARGWAWRVCICNCLVVIGRVSLFERAKGGGGGEGWGSVKKEGST